MTAPVLIACGYNEAMAAAATSEGWLYGTGDAPRCEEVGFVDTEDWANGWQPRNIARLLQLAVRYHPFEVVVPDVTCAALLEPALRLAEQLIALGCRPIIVPKTMAVDWLRDVPRWPMVVFGYPIPTLHGSPIDVITGKVLDTRIYNGRDIHALGGSPQAQMRLYKSIHPLHAGFGLDGGFTGSRLVSVDGNMVGKAALGQMRGGVCYWQDNGFVGLGSFIGPLPDEDTNTFAARLSFRNIKVAWQGLTKERDCYGRRTDRNCGAG